MYLSWFQLDNRMLWILILGIPVLVFVAMMLMFSQFMPRITLATPKVLGLPRVSGQYRFRSVFGRPGSKWILLSLLALAWDDASSRWISYRLIIGITVASLLSIPAFQHHAMKEADLGKRDSNDHNEYEHQKRQPVQDGS